MSTGHENSAAAIESPRNNAAENFSSANDTASRAGVQEAYLEMGKQSSDLQKPNGDKATDDQKLGTDSKKDGLPNQLGDKPESNDKGLVDMEIDGDKKKFTYDASQRKDGMTSMMEDTSDPSKKLTNRNYEGRPDGLKVHTSTESGGKTTDSKVYEQGKGPGGLTDETTMKGNGGFEAHRNFDPTRSQDGMSSEIVKDANGVMNTERSFKGHPAGLEKESISTDKKAGTESTVYQFDNGTSVNVNRGPNGESVQALDKNGMVLGGQDMVDTQTTQQKLPTDAKNLDGTAGDTTVKTLEHKVGDAKTEGDGSVQKLGGEIKGDDAPLTRGFKKVGGEQNPDGQPKGDGSEHTPDGPKKVGVEQVPEAKPKKDGVEQTPDGQPKGDGSEHTPDGPKKVGVEQTPDGQPKGDGSEHTPDGPKKVGVEQVPEAKPKKDGEKDPRDQQINDELGKFKEKLEKDNKLPPLKKGQGPYHAIEEAIKNGQMPEMKPKEILKEARRMRDRDLVDGKKHYKVGEQIEREKPEELNKKVEAERQRLEQKYKPEQKDQNKNPGEPELEQKPEQKRPGEQDVERKPGEPEVDKKPGEKKPGEPEVDKKPGEKKPGDPEVPGEKPGDKKPGDGNVPDGKLPDGGKKPADTPEVPKKPEELEKPKDPEGDKPKGLRVENRGASKEFEAEIQKKIDALPEDVKQRLQANGTKIIIGNNTTQVRPDLKDQHPRGHLPGTTWDHLEGLYDPNKNEVVISENKLNSAGEMVKGNRPEGVFKHEVGHAMDAALGNFSQTDEFNQAFEKDAANLSPMEKLKLRYLMNKEGGAGKSETFAEVWGAMNGSSANPEETPATLRNFPNVAEAIRARMARQPK